MNQKKSSVPFITLKIIALKNVWRNRKRSLISMSTIALAVMTITLLFGWLEGLKNDIATNVINHSSGHIRIRNSQFDAYERLNPLSYSIEGISDIVAELQTLPFVDSLSPRISAGSMLYYGADQSVPILCIGIDSTLEESFYQPALLEGERLSAVPRGQRFPPALLTSGIADRLNLKPGAVFTILSATMHHSTNAKGFTTQGIIHFPVTTMNAATVLLPLEEAQKLFQMPDRVTELLIKIQPSTSLDNARAVIAERLETAGYTNLVVQAWDEIDSAYQIIKLADVSYTIIAIIFFLLGSVSMINTTMMAVFERRREIGMLSALGMESGKIRMLFFLESMAIGIFGAIAGSLIGIGIVLPLSITGIDLSTRFESIDFDMSTIIYPRLNITSTLFVLIYAIIIVALVGYLACRKSSRMDPVAALRHET